MAKRAGGSRPPPKCKAILICDQVLVDAVTGRISLIGVFNSFSVQRLPATTPTFSVFLQLTDGNARCRVTIEMHDLREGEVIARSPAMDLAFPERLATVNVVFPCPPLVIEHAGAYDVVVFSDTLEIDRQKLSIGFRDKDFDGDEYEDN